MKIGAGLPQIEGTDLGRDVTDMAVRAEAAGASSVWAYERVLYPTHPVTGMYGVEGLGWSSFYRQAADPLTVLTAAATATTTVRLGTSVLIAPLHAPLHLARALATLDQLSGGRVIAGWGTGWALEEYRAAGADFARRGDLLDETIDACRAIWAEGTTTFRGEGILIEDALTLPRPAHDIPIMLGGGTTGRSLRRIATRSDGWLPVNTLGPDLATAWDGIGQAALEAGRDPAALSVIPRANIIVTDTSPGPDRMPFQGTWDEVVADVVGVAEAGMPELIVDPVMSARNGAHQIDLTLEALDRLRSAGVLS